MRVKLHATRTFVKTMLRISDLCPIFFSQQRYKFAREEYIQRFHYTDKLVIEILGMPSETFEVYLNNPDGTSRRIPFDYYDLNEEERASYCIISGLSDGIYTITAYLGGAVKHSEPFLFCSSSSLLEETNLIKYSHDNNNHPKFDTVFWFGEMQLYFEFRVEAGFKPSGTSFKVDVEQFRNQYQDIKELYSVPYETNTLTIGNSMGVPIWIGKLFNNLLSVKYVFINDSRYKRSESSVPEISPVMEGEQMFFFTVTLEPARGVATGGYTRIFDLTFSKEFG